MRDAVRVLLVEDYRDDRELYEVAFGLEGIDVASADSAAAALAVAGRFAPDVLVTDLALPDASGCEVLRALRARGLVVPAIALTAHPETELYEAAVEAGFDAYLVKPCLPDKVVALVRARARPREATAADSDERIAA